MEPARHSASDAKAIAIDSSVELKMSIVHLVFAMLLSVTSTFGVAQGNYPNGPIRMIVPFAAGGPADVVGRIMAAELSGQLKQSVVVENKSGAGIVVGTESVARSAPDGYTILLATIAHTVASAMFKSIPFDPIKDFSPVGLIGSVPLVMVVRPSLNMLKTLFNWQRPVRENTILAQRAMEQLTIFLQPYSRRGQESTWCTLNTAEQPLRYWIFWPGVWIS